MSNFANFAPITTFNEAFDKAVDIPFNKEWENGTGYFDYAVYGEHAPSVPNGEMVRSVTPQGRRILIIGTRMGNVVVFTRHSDWEKCENPIMVTNMSLKARRTMCICDGSVNYDTMGTLVGNIAYKNIGLRIEDICAFC